MKHLKLFESFNYNIKTFTQSEFTKFYIDNYGNDYKLKERIEYFSYSDLSHQSYDDYGKSIRFIVAYNDKDILGMAKYAYYSIQKRHGISFISTNNSFQRRGISINLLDEMLRYFSEHNKDKTLGMSEYTIEGWKSLRLNFRKFAKKYGVKIKEQKIGYKVKTDADIDLYKQSKKEIQELYPGTYPEMLESATNFEEWFGDSKVVKEGKPLIVYHGTDKDFEKFKEKAGKKSKSKQQMDFGIHFSENPKDSEIYTKKKGTIYPVYLRVENPLDLTKGTWWNDDPDFDKMVIFAEKLLKVSRLIKRNHVFSKYDKNGKIIDGIGSVSIVQNMLDKIIPSKVYKLVSDNFDGIIYQPYQIQGFNTISKFAKSYIVFSPTQIKSVANIGTYDLTNPKMLENKDNIMIKESLQTPELASGKAAFKIFLKIINSDNLFSTKKYLNKGKYLYFFYTDRIQNNEDIINELEVRSSLETAYKTIYKLKDKRLSFFFAIDEFKLFYGFYDDITHLIYKVGRYNVHDSDLRNLPDLDCLKKVNDVLIKDVDIKKRRFINDIKEDLRKLFPTTDSKIEITSSTVVRKVVEMSNFNETDQDYNRMSVTLDKFAEGFDWYKKVHTYIEIDDDNVSFYIKII